jgi:hypothetical protein
LVSISPNFNPGRGSPITSVPTKFVPKKGPIQDLIPGKVIIPGGPATGGQLDMSYMNAQLEEAKRAEARANQAYKALRVEHQQAINELAQVDQRIIQAALAQKKLQNGESPLKEFSKLQRRTLNTIGLGDIGNKQSFGLAAITIALGITAILGRVD